VHSRRFTPLCWYKNTLGTLDGYISQTTDLELLHRLIIPLYPYIHLKQ
jgi:hypothetical protein